jgi:hypothetical protein
MEFQQALAEIMRKRSSGDREKNAVSKYVCRDNVRKISTKKSAT